LRIRFSFGLAILALVVCPSPAAAAERPTVLASVDDAFVAYQASTDLWTIGSRQLELVVGLTQDRTLALQRLSNPITQRIWNIKPDADVSLTVGGERVEFTSQGVMSLVNVAASADLNGVRLTFTFEHRLLKVRFARTYACYPGSPTIETSTRIDASNATSALTLTDLIAWRITMPVATVKWLGGLRGDNADNAEAGAFALASRDLATGERIEIGSEERSTEQFVPFVLVDAGVDEFYGGIMWSGAWQIAFERVSADDLTVSARFPGTSPAVAPDQPIELPHAFFGLTSHSADDESGALHQFIMRGIRRGRPFQPLVTYNTWFAYGATINQRVLSNEMARASAMGVELFVVDAGWYVGAGALGDYDFESGLGTWTEDADRFPDGLAALAEEAHGAGMKFGIWVEPERTALATVDRPGMAHESWLATRDGSYGSQNTAQICLVDRGARAWAFERLVALIDATHADYLKWDNNFWINCNRPGHGHGASDGNFAHVQALYALLAELRQRYPNLLIENVSGGGNRLDFGMLAYTDVAWMDDRTAPSTHVRHNLEGLTAAFPPAYLLSFVIDSEVDPIRSSADFPLVVRSRMPGVLGMTYRSSAFDETLTEQLSREIRHYKAYRDIIAQANATLLSDQAPVDEEQWDVLQETADSGRKVIIFAFKGNESDGRLLVRPRGLIGGATYDVRSLDVGALGTASADLLMKDGIELVHAGGSRAHVILLTAQ
jgi:alpha-galactosidase